MNNHPKLQEQGNVKPSRRSVLTWLGAAAGGAVAAMAGWRLAVGRGWNPGGVAASETPPLPAVPASPETLPVVTGALRHEVFAPHLNEPFQISFSGRTAVDCKLAGVGAPVVAETFRGRFVTFNLLFEAPRSLHIADGGLFEVAHPEAGVFELFLSPVGRPKDAVIFLEAVCSGRVS